MSSGLFSLTLILTILLILASGMYISTGLAFLGVFILIVFRSTMIRILGNVLYNSTASFTLAAIPIFLFMGELVMRTGISKSLYNGVSKWLSPFPGGLLLSNILSCSLFAAISGSSVATGATIGNIAFKEQKERDYPVKLIAGSLAAGGTLGILIPPSITMIVYGAMVGQSIGKLFMAGIIPGIIMSLLFMLYIVIYSVIHKEKVPQVSRFNIVEYFKSFIMSWKDVWPIVLILLTIFIGIYGGFMTPTEAAAISVGETMIIAFIFGKLNLKILKESAVKSLETTAMVMFIYIGATILGNSIAMIKLPAHLCRAIANLGINRFGILFLIIIIYIILGCLMEAMSAIIITLPITYPLIVETLHFNPIWFGILLVILNQVGLITPPVGLNVYVIYGISGEKNIGTIFEGILPFFILMCITILLIILFPQIVLFLPGKMFAI